MVMGVRGSRRRVARVLAPLGVAALIVAATALGGGVAVAGAAACPNEGLREQSRVDPATGQPFSVALPECRAYEMVSPLEKQGHDAGIKGGLLNFYQASEVAVSPAGDALAWTTQPAIAEPQNFAEAPSPEQPYLSRRGESGWHTANSLVPVNLVRQPFKSGPFGDFSPDLTSHQVSCGQVDGISAGEGGFYRSLSCARRQGEGPWEATPLFTPPDGTPTSSNGTLAYEAGSADLSRVFLQPDVTLLPGDFRPTDGSEATAGIYEVSPVGPAAQLRLVNVGHEGAKPGLLVRRPEAGQTEPPLLGAERPKGEFTQGTQYHAVSQSGETVFFGATPQDGELESWATAPEERGADALYARIPCSAEFLSVPCETEAEGHAVAGRQTIKVSDPNEAEGCAACAATTAVSSATTTSGSTIVSVAGVATGLKDVHEGMAVSGTGIPEGTSVVSLSTSSLTLSKPAEASSETGGATLTFTPEVAGIETTSGSSEVTVASGGFPGVKAGMAVTGPGIPSGTSVSAMAGEKVLTLSTNAEATATAVTLKFQVARAPVVFRGASADGSKVFFTTTQKVLMPAGTSPASTTNLYEYDFAKKGQDKLVDLTATSSPEGARVLGVVKSSSDGSHIYFIAEGVLASKGVLVSKGPEIEPTPGVRQGSPGPTPGGRNLYGIDTNSDTTKFIAAVSGLNFTEGETSDGQPHAQTTLDGRDLVFDSQSQLAGDTNPPAVNYLSLTHSAEKTSGALGVTLTFSASGFSTEVPGVHTVQGQREVSVVSGGFPGVTEGMSVAGTGIFPGTTVAALVKPEVVYRYDFEAGSEEGGGLTWISQASPELKANPNEGLSAWISENPAGGSTRGGFADVDDYNRAITGENDGKHDGEDIIFTTQERLAPGDKAVGKVPQLYLWHCTLPCPHAESEGTVRMISDGRSDVEPVQSEGVEHSPGASPTTAISASGSDIFFSTRTTLVGQDTDELLDYYDARINGGVPAPAVQPACASEECQPPASKSLVGSFGPSPSSLLAAGGNLAPPTGGLLAFHTIKPKPLTRAQKLAKALRACKTKPRRRRAACNAQARQRYGSKAKKSKRRAK
jgi:hypothetical protein